MDLSAAEATRLVVSAIALAVSAYSVWRTELRPFRLGILCSNPTFKVYPIKAGDQTWFLPSLDLDITCWNGGTRPGILNGVRARVTVGSAEEDSRSTQYLPVFVVDFPRFSQAHTRKEMIETTVSKWYGLPVLDKTPRTLHLVLEPPAGRWDEEPGIFDLDVDIQVRSTEWPAWSSLGKFHFPHVDPSTGSYTLTKMRPGQGGLVGRAVDEKGNYL